MWSAETSRHTSGIPSDQNHPLDQIWRDRSILLNVRPTKLNTSEKVSIAAILVVAIVLMVLLILLTASDKWSPL
jgi:hypothetical protein